jgi:hypothetical protein
MTDPPPRMFMLTLVATGPGDPYLAIRALLKLALRRHGLRCTMARELPPPKSGEKAPPQSPQPDRTQAHEPRRTSTHRAGA